MRRTAVVKIDRDAKLLEEWAKALESGKYQQGSHKLRKTGAESGKDMWCCLGVLCDMFPLGGRWELDGDRRWYHFKSGADKVVNWPPLSIIKTAGLTVEEINTLASLNDQGYSFVQIADYIRSVILGDEDNEGWMAANHPPEKQDA